MRGGQKTGGIGVKCGWAAASLGAAVLLVFALDLPVHAVIPDTDLLFLSESAPVAAKSTSFLPSVLRPIIGVLLLGAVLWGSLIYAYRRRSREAGTDVIQVLAAAPVAQGVIVEIIDVGGIFFVVAISRNGPTVLGQITDREKISELRSRVAKEELSLAVPPIPFKKTLERWFRPNRSAEDPTGEPPASSSRPAARDTILQEAIDRVRRLNPHD